MILKKTVNQEPECTKNRWKSWKHIKKRSLWEYTRECTFSILCCCSITL